MSMLPAGGGGPVVFATAPVGVIDWWGLRTGGGGGFTVRATSAVRDPESSEPLIVAFKARQSALLRLRSDMLVKTRKGGRRKRDKQVDSKGRLHLCQVKDGAMP